MRNSPLLAGLIVALSSNAPIAADVVINEFVAAASERLVGVDLVTGGLRLGSSTPWYEPGFDDSSWLAGAAPLGANYGGLATNVSASFEGNPAALYVRTAFNASAGGSGDLLLDIDYDDGFIAYVNGQEVARRNMGHAGSLAFHDQPAFNNRDSAWSTISLGAVADLLVGGENALAIQVHDRGDSTLKFEAALRSSGGATFVPTGSTWQHFVGTVEPSGGIYDVGQVGGAGELAFEWTKVDFDHTGWDFGFAPIGYDTSGDYTLSTDLAGQMRNITPSVYIRYPFTTSTEQIAGFDTVSATVDYDDGFVMYLNGVEVARRNMGAPGTLVTHDTTAASSHGAREEGGGNNPSVVETIVINPALMVDGQNILSVQAHNVSLGSSDFVFGATVSATGPAARSLVGSGTLGFHFVGVTEPSEIAVVPEREKQRFSDWIELHNNGAEAVDLEGWSLSDSATGKRWSFPAATSIAADGYLVVLASGKDITAPAAGDLLQTDFKLNASGEFLGLLDAGGELVSGFDPEYPQQDFFHSYGRNASGEPVYFHRASPGAPNAGVEYSQIVAPPTIDTETGFYESMPAVRLAETTPGSVIRYTTDGSTPTETNGVEYTGGVLGSVESLQEGPIGSILRESWYGVPGSDIADIPLTATPDLVSNVQFASVPPNFTDNYGSRLHGWIHPPESGDFTFWIACDERGEVWLSNDENPSGAVRIAHTPGPTGSAEYDKYPQQQSAPITLAAGSKYYISILHKESTGSDHLRAQWEGPGIARDTIRGAHLSPVVAEVTGNAANTLVKARAFLPGAIPSEVVTRTYAVGYDAGMHHGPSIFLSGDAERVFYAPDGVTTISGGVYNSGRWSAVDVEQDYSFALAEGRPYEREATLEIVMPDGMLGARTDFGVRLGGSPHARPRYVTSPLATSPWLGSWTSKPSLNFFFRDDYGAEALDVTLMPDQAAGGFGSMRLRAGKNDSSNPFIRDEVMRRISWATGQAASRGVFSNLWINGKHKAYFNLTERLREPFFQRHYQSDNEWDIWHIREIVEGDNVHYNATMNLLRSQPMTVDANYAAAEERVDMANYIDYVITNAYGATGDWPHNNYNVSRERVEGGRWTFNVWDAEGSFGNFGHNVNTNTLAEELGGSPSGDTHMSRIVYRACKNNPEFRLLFADRIQKHFFNDGGLTQSNLRAIFDETYAEFAPIYTAVRGGLPSTGFFNNWHPTRRGILFTHFQGEGMWPSTTPPDFSQHGGSVEIGFELTVSGAPAGGEIYYTTDGSDPRGRGGSVLGQRYSAPLPIDQTALVKARVRSSGGEWSAVTEAVFVAPEPPALAITEIHFNPDGDDATEFIELQNVGDTDIDLTGIHFSSGLTLTFGPGVLAPGARLVLVRDATAFAAAYPGVAIGGTFEAGALDNGGERLVIAEPGGRVIVEVDYGDSLDAADGGGYSLVLAPGADPALPESWVSEYVLGGTPGIASLTEFTGDPDADGDGDGLTDLLEYALATDPAQFTTNPWRVAPDGLEIDWNIGAPDLVFSVETSVDGETWSEAAGQVTLLGDGRATTGLPVGVGLQMVRARCQLR